MTKFGLDLSYYQRGINFNTLKSQGVEFTILRAGYTGYGTGTECVKDTSFETFYNDAKSAGIPVGAYWYSCANNAAKGKAEAEFMYNNCLKGKQFEYPIYIDVEESRHQANDKAGVTDAIISFCETLEDKGYFVGVYANTDWFNNKIDTARLKDYSIWLAHWTTNKPDFNYGFYGLWQSSSSGSYAGYRVDTNFAYVDYPDVIKKAGLNGFSTSKPVPVPTPTPVPVVTDFKVGDTVIVNGHVYENSYGANQGIKLTNHTGKITYTNFKGNKPYHIDSLGWVSASAVSKPSPSKEINVGDKVKVNKAITYEGKRFKLYYDVYDVLEVNGDRVVIGIGSTVTAAVKKSNLTKV